MLSARYDPSCFNVRTIPQAKGIILTPEDSTTEDRWNVETPYLAGLMIEHLNLRHDHRVLDYGCGIGRMTKALIDQTLCMGIGIDISVSMRALAAAYVDEDRFFAAHPACLETLGSMDAAIAVWALQHIPDIRHAIASIHRALKPGRRLFVVNMNRRALPVDGGTWIDDGVDVRELLCARFQEVAFSALDPDRTTPLTAQHAYWAVYQRA